MNESCATDDLLSVPLWRTLMRASEMVESRLESALADSGLSLAKMGVLDNLVKAGEPLPLSRLAGRLSCVKSNMTQLVDRLETDGLVERVADPKDRRSVLAAITSKGRERYEAGRDALREQERALLKSFGEGEQEQLSEFLGRLSAA